MKIISVFLGLLALFSAHGQSSGDKWTDILVNKEGKVVFYWYPNNNRIEESRDILDGVEYDLAKSFIDYINAKYEVNISMEWIETKDFNDVMDTVRNSESGVFGASSISITEERSEYLNFTPPYLSDVAVLVSSPNIPLARTAKEFNRLFDSLTAISIPNTTLNNALNQLRLDKNLHFKTDYVSNSGEIIDRIENSPNSFGYIDLPNFLVAFDHLSKVRRQFFYPLKMEGIAMIYSLNSDWNIPVEDYFGSDQFELDRRKIISKYFGEEVMEVVRRVSTSAEIGPLEEIVISTRERELQYEELLEAAEREKDRIRVSNALLIGFITVAFVLLFLYISFQIKSRANAKLLQQQKLIANRNEQLQILNEEKNDLIQILAHDLRSPISNITGCADLLKESKGLDKDSEKMISFISQSSEKMESMIAKILDVDALDSGDNNLTIEEINIIEVLDAVIAENSSRAEAKEIFLKTKFEKQALNVIADAFYSSQVFDNLISNAIKFSEKNTEIVVSVKKVNSEAVQISVKDQGPGLTEDDKNKMFKKYQVLSATPTAGERSTGIGLSIVKLYAEMMNGTVSFESELGVGTIFIVTLPLA
ncbi:MAG: ATP-binding protein [Ekhidna sp.]